jgi:hypothetical protein
MHPLAPIYARLIMAGLKTMADVPDNGTLRADVQDILDSNGWQS